MSPRAGRAAACALALGALAAAFAWLHPGFLGSRNLSQLAVEFSTSGILALGMFLVIVSGQVDLSAGSGAGLLGGIAAVLVFRRGWSAPAALAVSAALGPLLWRGMGRLVASQRLPSFIVTLGGLLAFKGLFWTVIRNSTVPVSPAGAPNLYARLSAACLPPGAGWALAAAAAAGLLWAHARRAARARRAGLPYDEEEELLKAIVLAQCAALFVAVMNGHRGVPVPAVLFAAWAVFVIVLSERTLLGRAFYAVGGNEEAARLAGVDPAATTAWAFTFMGAAAALTGFLQTAYAGASTTTVGELMELDAVAACVIGGVSLKGGRGRAWGAAFGALLMAVLLNGMTLLAVPPEAKFAVRGLVLVLAVWLDARLSGGAQPQGV